jgi:predicted Fe-Mo cluster-binding NifX family protein
MRWRFLHAKKLRIAVPTAGDGGLDDKVSEVFGRATTFTIVNVEEGKLEAVEVFRNPALSYKYGAGPIVVKMLIDRGVTTVVAGELGLGASGLLEQQGISLVRTQPGLMVSEALRTSRLVSV